MHIEQMCDASHQPPAFTGQDIQCHPQVLTKHTVKYKTMNGTDVNNTHNIQYNLAANIVESSAGQMFAGNTVLNNGHLCVCMWRGGGEGEG